MSVAVVTGSTGLIGSEAAVHFNRLGLDIAGIDNDMRSVFFGAEASTSWNRSRLERMLGNGYRHHDVDIRDRDAVDALFARYGPSVELVVHAAAQPSHDWAAREPLTDFDINAVGTLNVLEATRRHAPEAVFIFTSTNKVYGDTPNSLPLVELEKRWEIRPDHTYANGIREDMPIDRCLHSLFGASKVAADILTQEYGRYFGVRTGVFRGGTLTGPNHSAAELHGFLAYVMRCAMTGTSYTVYGYGGRQVRDAIHSRDLIAAFEAFFRAPRVAEVYNIGGGRFSNASVIEAIELAEEISGKKLRWTYSAQNRIGDHIWWIGDNGRFESHYPDWRLEYDVGRILREIFEANADRWVPGRVGLTPGKVARDALL
jgi:CDP-paratose 2-epimerase